MNISPEVPRGISTPGRTALPTLFWMTFQGSGTREALEVIPRWLSFCIFFWWPVGALLSGGRTRGWIRFFAGYALSIPLYFLCLFLVYPAFGGNFQPLAHHTRPIYLSSTPQFFLVFTVCKRGRLRIARRLPS
jgi:hypothetical protein